MSELLLDALSEGTLSSTGRDKAHKLLKRVYELATDQAVKATALHDPSDDPSHDQSLFAAQVYSRLVSKLTLHDLLSYDDTD